MSEASDVSLRLDLTSPALWHQFEGHPVNGPPRQLKRVPLRSESGRPTSPRERNSHPAACGREVLAGRASIIDGARPR